MNRIEGKAEMFLLVTLEDQFQMLFNTMTLFKFLLIFGIIDFVLVLCTWEILQLSEGEKLLWTWKKDWLNQVSYNVSNARRKYSKNGAQKNQCMKENLQFIPFVTRKTVPFIHLPLRTTEETARMWNNCVHRTETCVVPMGHRLFLYPRPQ